MAETSKKKTTTSKGSKSGGSPNRKDSSKNSSGKGSKQEQIKEMQEKRQRDRRIIDEIWAVVILAVGVFLIFTTQLNTTGAFGDAIHDCLKGLFGVMAYVRPYYFIICAFCLFFRKMQHINLRTGFFSILMYLMLCLLNACRYIDPNDLRYQFHDMLMYYRKGVEGEYGGAIGMEFGSILVNYFGKTGLIIIAITVIIISILLIINTPISKYLSDFAEHREEKRLLREMDKEEKAQNAALAAAQTAAQQRDFSALEDDTRIRTEINTHGRDRVIEPEPDDKPLIRIINPLKTPEPDFLRVEDTGTRSVSSAAETGTSGTGVPEPPVKEAPEKKNRLAQFLTGSDFSDIGSGAKKDKTTRIGFGLDEESTSSSGYGLEGYADSKEQKKEREEQEEYERIRKAAKKEREREERARATGLDGIPDEIPEKTATSHLDEAADLAAAAAALNTKEVKKANTPTKEDAEEVMKQAADSLTKTEEKKQYHLPPVDLLRKPKGSQMMMSNHQLEEKAELLEQTLRNFHVDAKVLTVTQGSSVTRYEVQPAIGVKVSSITKLSDDIALNLRAKSIRIEAPIPGKAAVGIEVENEKAAPVLIRELIDSEEFRKARSKITFVVGKNISGQNIVANLKDMPHLLIAGATGSGKSVCINTIIASILYKATPDEVKMILIDPKVVELGNYNGIPHMLIPVVTDPKKAAAALNWAVNEMTQRYKKFAEEGVKDLDSYNELMIANQEPEKVMPQVVIIIDELADLMMAAPSQVEECICRLAQMARAAGMHLIVATQRPSVDIVTGLIKANIPSRIAFSVSSQFDSRTILDVGGAEKLLGKGDMLFSPVGSNKPIRIQGPYISDTETSKIIQFVKKQEDADYSSELNQFLESPEKGGPTGAGDELTEDAIAFILKSRKASVSMLQRRFRIGYNRAASIIDEIEERGIISPADGSKPRQVLYTEEEYYSAADYNEEESTAEQNE
ncbi:MAG: DNA translocase FtsK 4TM domain-containing protein [Mogibacterium sp.]|nr:DNA translocase FtsK 4TM domain-containing protein [Mogibacterium sp.]